MFSVFIFLFGLSVGSFLNVVICRLKSKEPILLSRSHCPHCGTVLKWFDLIPLLSFLIQKGKCRYCGQKISPQYPLVELATGLSFLIIFNQFPIFNLFFYLIIISFLIVIFVYDLKHYLIPDKIVFPAIGLTFLYQFFENSFLNSLLAALLAAGFFLSLVLISKGKWMGLGDVKLVGLMGLVLGWPNICLALFLAFLSGAIVGIGLIIAGKKGLKSQIPFGPFLSANTVVVLFYGSQLIEKFLTIDNLFI
ncbi:MAG: prepilin peptidase [Candidatus Portnoybacteria bacterium]|nr:prepilin peptidase [Candidatus Portnoybacteria bacterium]